MNLTEYCTGIADAIREKEGSTGLIPAPDHAARIKAIKAGAELETVPVILGANNTVTISNGLPVVMYATVDADGNPSTVKLYEYAPNTVLNVLKGSVITILSPSCQYQNNSSGTEVAMHAHTHKTTGYSTSVYFIKDAPSDGSPIIFSVACYIRGTLITLADGRTKPVEDIAYSDDLLVWDFDNGCYSSAKPLWIKSAAVVTEFFRCVFEDGATLHLINNKGNAHRVFCLDTNRFEYASDCVGKMVMTQNGAVKLVSCDLVNKTDEYYNIITDYHMNVYANGVLTSTGLNNLYPVVGMKFVKEERELIPIDAFDDCPENYYYGMRLGEQVNYSIERINEKIQLIKSLAVENGY